MQRSLLAILLATALSVGAAASPASALDGKDRIRSVKTKECATAKSSGQIKMEKCTNKKRQKWFGTRDASFENEKTGLCLTVLNSRAVQQQCGIAGGVQKFGGGAGEIRVGDRRSNVCVVAFKDFLELGDCSSDRAIFR